MHILLLLCLTALLAAAPSPAGAAEPGWKTAGVRGGVSVTSGRYVYHEYEAFAVYQLPWSWRYSNGLGISTQIDGSAGALRGKDTNAFIGTIGPDFVFDKEGIPVELELGMNFAFLNTPAFGLESFEGDVQFISHIGVNLRATDLLGVDLRFQHMSNGGIYGGFNPGVNMVLLSLNFYP